MRLARTKLLTLLTTLLACALGACAGGSGSSGFDISPSAENAAIAAALQDRQCVASDGLTICPSDEPGLSSPPGAEPTAENVGVDTGLAFQDSVRCTAVGVDGPCSFEFFVSVDGFESEAAVQVAWRVPEQESAWRLAGDAVPLTGIGPSVEVALDAGTTDTHVQVAVLVFRQAAGAAPGRVRTLAETGADFAFVTPELPVFGG